MPSYATQQDIIDRYGEETLLLLADRDDDQVIDGTVVDQALADASAEIDTYVAAKYPLPLPSVPDALVRLCVDIAIYRMAASSDVATEEQRKRYEDARTLLRRISLGESSLGLPEPPASTNEAVFVSSQKRRFGRGRLL